LACAEDCAEAFAPLAAEAGFCLLPGPKEDVLRRYCLVIRRFGIDRVIRATGDNPFVFADAAGALNREAAALGAHYAGYSGLPYGAGVESVDAAALLRSDAEAAAPLEREHVCPYLYGHPELFRLHRPLAPLPWQAPEIRLTVDTAEDYDRAEHLYQSLAHSVDPQEGHNGETIIAHYDRIFSPAPGIVPEYSTKFPPKAAP
jgi:spore coat polysaccharide biosynthesis protein SpsF